jgi:DNA-binding PadR family transcriptional regulator
MTNAELVILSLIAECPRHGYDLEKVIEERGMRNWTEIAFSSIYFLLNKLVKEGLVIGCSQPAVGRGPAKKVYSITKTGIIELKEGVRAGLSAKEPGTQAFMLGLSCLPLLPQDEVLNALRERKLFLLGRLEELQKHPALIEPGYPPHVKAMFTYSLPLLQAELEWLENFIQEIKKGNVYYGKDRSEEEV